MKVRDLGSFIRDQRKQASLSLRKLAQVAGISNPYLSQIERGLRRPSAVMLQRIAKALQISAETMYVQAGILDEAEVTDLRRAIAADRSLTARQKEALLQVYESFREETETKRSRRQSSRSAAPRGARKAAAAG